MERIDRLLTDTMRKLRGAGCELDREILFDTCLNLCEAGVVVQLFLVPYTTLVEYIVLTSGGAP